MLNACRTAVAGIGNTDNRRILRVFVSRFFTRISYYKAARRAYLLVLGFSNKIPVAAVNVN